MASTPYPLPRETRESSILTGNGTVGPYGPTTFKVFDTADVEIWARPAGQAAFSPVSGFTVQKTSGAPFDTVSVTFPLAVPATTAFIIRGARTHERLLAVTRAGAIDSDQLERELTRQGTVLSEARRDLGRALMVSPGSAGSPILYPEEGKVLAWGADGNLVNAPMSEADLAAEVQAAKEARSDAEDAAQTATSAVANLSGMVADAVVAAARAEAASDSAVANADVYADTAAGLAATTNGQQFQVVSEKEIVRYRNDAGVATEVARYPTAAAVDDTYRERLMARRSAWLEDARLRPLAGPPAAVVILLGQSNNAPRGVSVSGSVSPQAFMPVGGNSITYFPYNATNVLWVAHWDDLASAVTLQEGTGETPCSGVAIGLLGGRFQRVYVGSCAIGARSLDVLRGGGPATNLHAVISRLCDIARADGYEPEVLFDVHHGESDAVAATGEDGYVERGWQYYRQAQAFAAQAMQRPQYDAPIVFHVPVAFGSFGSAPEARKIAAAIVRLSSALPAGILAGGSYQFPTESDRSHQTPAGMRERGEQGGYLLRRFTDRIEQRQALQIVDAMRAGTSVKVVFNRLVMRDETVLHGTNLNAANALAGFEFDDDGAYIKIDSLTVAGRVVTLALASVPTGAAQHLQIACQTMTGALTAGTQNLAGSQMRSPSDGEPSIHDPALTIHDFAIPQRIAVRS